MNRSLADRDSVSGMRDGNGLFDAPLVLVVREATAVRAEETAAMFPECGPDVFAVVDGKSEGRDCVAAMELEAALAVRRWNLFQRRAQFEEEHQPVSLPMIAAFADHSGQDPIGGSCFDAEFFMSFAAGARVGRFAQFGLEFAARRAPAAAIGFVRPFDQQDLVALVEAVEEGRDLVRQRHRAE